MSDHIERMKTEHKDLKVKTDALEESWIDATVTLPSENEKVLVCTDENLIYCAIFQRIGRYTAEDAPKDDRWFASPGLGHELKVAYWRVLPDFPV